VTLTANFKFECVSGANRDSEVDETALPWRGNRASNSAATALRCYLLRRHVTRLGLAVLSIRHQEFVGVLSYLELGAFTSDQVHYI
jgi:hypothetical protein